jgi:hypothetical protein
VLDYITHNTAYSTNQTEFSQSRMENWGFGVVQYNRTEFFQAKGKLGVQDRTANGLNSFRPKWEIGGGGVICISLYLTITHVIARISISQIYLYINVFSLQMYLNIYISLLSNISLYISLLKYQCISICSLT